MFEIQFCDRLESEEFYPDSTGFTLYHSELWNRIVSEGFGVQVNWIVCREGSRVFAAMPIACLRRFGFLFCGSPLQGLFTEFAGPVFDKELFPADRLLIFKEILLQLKKLRPSRLEFTFSEPSVLADKAGEDFLLQLGFRYMPRSTLIVPLGAGLGNVWNSFHGRARNMIRKSLKEKVSGEVELLSDRTLDLYLDMLAGTFRRQGIASVHPDRAYRIQAEILGSSDSLFFVAARLDGELVSGGVFLVDRDRVVFHSGSSTPLGLKSAASSLVQWVAIQEASRRKALWYDMGGTGVDSIDRFKTTFGGMPMTHGRWVYETRTAYFGRILAMQLARRGFLSVFEK